MRGEELGRKNRGYRRKEGRVGWRKEGRKDLKLVKPVERRMI